jgi:malto-oligosyltrehalose synthase
MNIPRATLRLQFHRGFTFANAANLAGYFASLGVSHIYASPIMTARPGSLHGYDTVDPTRINPELGGEEEFRRLVRVLRNNGLGIILDIVPNHMAVGKDNPWWMDVLAAGRTSSYAKFFDIDWEPSNLHLRGKVLLPILGRPYGEALAAGEIKVKSNEGGVFIGYFDHLFPIARGNSSVVHQASAHAFDPTTNSGREQLHEILEEQCYRLAWWRTANDEINWRRFFDINELAALRMEVDEVFDTFHAEVFRLYREGLIDGVRVDHIDGLAQPGSYCRKLRSRLRECESSRPPEAAPGPAYIVVEKILSRGESLRQGWEVEGTTGYDFMDQINAVQHDAAGEPALSMLWTLISKRSSDFDREEELARQQILDRSFSAQREGVVRSLYVVAQSEINTRDIPWAAIRRVLTEILVHFPVYRIYARADQTTETDIRFLSDAVERAKRSCLPSDLWLVDRLAAWLAGEPIRKGNNPLQNSALVRFQQLSTSLCAKAVEDTAFYRYGRLVSRNDVGFDIRRFSSTPAQFHEAIQDRATTFPHTMLTTATHDHKRGEDVRARLAVLSERSEAWSSAVDRWIGALNSSSDTNAMPSLGDVAILLQMIVGAWPMAMHADDSGEIAVYARRIAAWQQKAIREAKLYSDWSAPNDAYENAAEAIVSKLFFERQDILKEIEGFARSIMAAGAVNGLAQALVKIAAPGVPDLYQGTEFWDFSLVDPDNRIPVDFAIRQASLNEDSSPTEYLANWQDGRIKQWTIARALAVRRKMHRTFSDGLYVPLDVVGPLADHVLAFARQLNDFRAIVVVPRCIAQILPDQNNISVAGNVWSNTQLQVPQHLQSVYGDAFALQNLSVGSAISIDGLFDQLPFALLMSTSS